ncbi:MAG: response regulator [Planctomycetota bacterium]
MRFLIVEDDPTILALIDNLLGELGHDCVCCEEGSQVDRVEGEIHGAIIDWHLGDTTCEPLTRRLKTTYPLIPMMIITGDTDLDLIQAAISLGVNDWWFKPTGLRNLKKQLRQIIADAARVHDQNNKHDAVA